MTYRSRAGRQFILIATGGGADASLLAFVLPADRSRAGRQFILIATGGGADASLLAFVLPAE